MDTNSDYGERPYACLPAPRAAVIERVLACAAAVAVAAASQAASQNVLAEAAHDPADFVDAKHGTLEHESLSSPNENRADWPDFMTSSRTDSSLRRSVPDMV